MPFAYKSFLSSPVFRLKGPAGATFFVHSNLIAQISRVFDRDVNGFMKEANDGTISIVDVDGDIDDGTVARFLEYAYTGDYAVPPRSERDPACSKFGLESDTSSVGGDPSKNDSPIIAQVAKNFTTVETLMEEPLLDSDPLPEVEPAEPAEPAETFGRYLLKKKDMKKRRIRRETFSYGDQDEPWGAPSPAPAAMSEETVEAAADFATFHTIAYTKQQMWNDFVSKATLLNKPVWEPQGPNGLSGDYAFDLLCHARLYVFSDRYECSDLAQLTLQKLQLTLSRFDPSEDVVAAVKLLKYTYDHTHERGRGGDKLRTMVVEYAVCHLEKLTANRRFKKLLRQEGAFADDLLTKAMQRLEGGDRAWSR